MIRTVRPKGNYYNLFDNIKVSLPFLRKWYSKDNSEDQHDKVIKKGYQIISWRDKVELSILEPRFQSNFRASLVKKYWWILSAEMQQVLRNFLSSNLSFKKCLINWVTSAELDLEPLKSWTNVRKKLNLAPFLCLARIDRFRKQTTAFKISHCPTHRHQNK